MTKSTSLANTAYLLFIITTLGWLSYIGSSILMPILFATLLAFFLSPINRFILRFVKLRTLSIILSFLTIVISLSIVAGLFSLQFMEIIESLPSISENIKVGFDKAIDIINDKIPFVNLDSKSIIKDNISIVLEGPLNVLSQGVISSTSVLVNIALTFIYTFFILFYRKSIRNFTIYQFEKSSRRGVKETIHEIQETVQSYIGGLGLVMIILTILNTIGLSIIGVKYAFFWGALAGLLAVIPYIGTILGGFLPFVYTLATADASWQPIAVVVYYLIIQQIEGNLITPKIVGDKVDINPLFAIFSLILFGSLWGVSGVILALPMISIIRIILDRFESTHPIALLMSSDIDSNRSEFVK